MPAAARSAILHRLSAVSAEQDRVDLRLVQQQILFGCNARFDPVVEQNHAVLQRIADAQVALAVPEQQIVRCEASNINDKRSGAVLQRLNTVMAAAYDCG